jgi:hypothetical protein
VHSLNLLIFEVFELLFCLFFYGEKKRVFLIGKMPSALSLSLALNYYSIVDCSYLHLNMMKLPFLLQLE